MKNYKSNVLVVNHGILLKMCMTKIMFKHIYAKIAEKKFNASTNTLLARTKLTYEQITIFFECMNDKLSIKKLLQKWELIKILYFYYAIRF